jgi:hypothetical protein
LNHYAADGDRFVDVEGRWALALPRYFDALRDTGGLLSGVDEGCVDAGPQARGIEEVQHGAHPGDDDQHPDCRSHRNPVSQRHGASRKT